MTAKKKGTTHRPTKEETAIRPGGEEGIDETTAPIPAGSELPLEIGLRRVLGRYWELANLDPETTKGNITGQLKALDSLCQELGFAENEQADRRASPTPAVRQQEIYRSAWLGTKQ